MNPREKNESNRLELNSYKRSHFLINLKGSFMFRSRTSKPTPLPLSQGQESVWNYPRPPALEKTAKHIQVIFANTVIADTTQAWRVLETSHPPVYYIPISDIQMNYLHPILPSSGCEWKGRAQYFDIKVNSQSVQQGGWTYPDPTPLFIPIQNHIAFYAQKMDRCLVDGEVVQPQPGEFYGGWITREIRGPFKGGTESFGW